ncbi:MAG TPA: glycosyltransferase family 39 protein [Aggregatilineaceae bacterium]|nr:glycosyltransferase family 39 protein [Aggregatilineaceae bacterium]
MNNHFERFVLLLILVIGAGLRFQHLGAIEYNVDQVYPIYQSIMTLDEGDFPLAGQGTSVLFANPPLTGYFFAPLIALVRHPIAAYLLTLILNTFAIWLAYRALSRLVGARPALIGAALFAVNPWIIEDSRRTWVQSLSPFFVCLIFWALVPVLTNQTPHPRRRLLIALVGFALFAHTYLLAYALAAPLGLLILIFWRRIPKPTLILGGFIFTVLMTLYGIGLARQWDDTTRRSEAFASGDSKLSGEALSHAIRLVTGWGYADVRGQRAPAADQSLRETLSLFSAAIWTLALLAGIILALLRLSPPFSTKWGKGAGGILILLIWFILPILMMSYVSRKVHPFYLLLTVPAGHGLVALALAPLLRRPKPAIPAVIGAALIFTGAINGLNTVRFAQATLAHPGEDLPETLPLVDAARVGETIRAAKLPVFSAMNEWTPITLNGHSLRTEWGTPSDFPTAVLVPPEGALYILFERDPNAAIIPPLHGDPIESPLVLADDTRITFWRVHVDSIQHPAALPSDIDVSFAGWAMTGDSTPGATITLDTYWRIETLHPERGIWGFAPFAHLYDANGQPVANVDGAVISPLTWQPGDLIAQRFTLTVPADTPYTIRVGLYDKVRPRADGSFINAIFRIPTNEEIEYSAEIQLEER